MKRFVQSQHSVKCSGKFVEGIAIKPEENCSICFPGHRLITAKNLEIINVAKCNKCGHSDDDLTLIKGAENE